MRARDLAGVAPGAAALARFPKLNGRVRRQPAGAVIRAGARGIKLHPRAEQFGLDEPGVREIVAEAHEGRLPVLIHAGRGIPALGAHVLELAGEFPRAQFILAHAGVCDLAWLWREVDRYPNVFFDTAWFSVPDLLVLFTHVAPGRILYATDIPFGSPKHGVVLAFCCALQAWVRRRSTSGPRWARAGCARPAARSRHLFPDERCGDLDRRR